MAVELLGILGVFFATTCACFLVGLGFAGYFDLEMHEKLSLSFGIGFSVLILLDVLIQINYFLGAGIFIGLIIHSIWRFITKSSAYKLDKDMNSLIFFYFAIITIGFSILIFSSFLGQDWGWQAYDYVQSINGGNFLPDKNRSSAWSVTVAFLLQLYQLPVEELWVAQMSSIFWNMCFLFPTYSIALKMFNKKVAWGTVFLMAFSPLFLIENYGLWGKMFATYCVLVAFYFLFYKKNNLISSVFTLLAFLVHTSFIIYFGIQLIILLIKKELFQRKHFLHYFIVIGGCATYIILNSIFAVGTGTPFAMLGYPFAVNGPDGLLGGTETLGEVFQDFLDTSFLSVVFWRVISFIFMVTPAWAGLAFYRILIPDTNPPIMSPTESLSNYYHISLFGIIGTIAGLILVLLLFDWIRKRYKIKPELLLSFLLPNIIIVLYIGWKNYGLSSQGNQAGYPFIAMIVIDYLLQKRWKRKWKILPFVGVSFELVVALLVTYLHSVNFATINAQTLHTINYFATDMIWNALWLIMSGGAIILSWFYLKKQNKLTNPFKDLFQDENVIEKIAP